ncbi:MAG: chromosome segregation protein SMC [bacterium]
MRLKKLQVSGFKSFVDPTDIRMPADLVAVVGPNGCGKSNVIDAVRWVMGEASAKMLRGDSMSDVIFNGSASRKPVGKASVELLFDNSDGAAGGNFAQFAEISVKRTLSRDGHSNYFINRIKTRRKDVLDLFRGTGLGPRSYSIIEQGMVSRIIEARPEDLRLFVEEAAGTSKYKDRRRETETRIGHTRENLARVADIRDELDKQLRRLQRQASAAKRYRAHKDEERLVGGQLLALKLQAMNDNLAQQERSLAQCQNRLDAALAEQRESEAEIERLRSSHGEAQARHGRVQQEYYNLGAEIAGVEQRIEHRAETKQREGEEIARLQSGRAQQQRQLRDDQTRLAQLQDEARAVAPEIEQLAEQRGLAEQRMAEAERALERWQGEWQAFTEQSQTPARQQEVQQSRIAQLQQHLERTTERAARFEAELAAAREMIAALDIASLRAEVQRHDDACEHAARALQQSEEAIHAAQQAAQAQRDESASLQARQHEASSRLDSLRQIQSAALAGDDQALQDWLAANGFDDAPKLAACIRVAEGWERAADRLLGARLGALCVAQLPHDAFADRPDCAFALIADAPAHQSSAPTSRARLIDKVDAGASDLSGFLDRVYLAESLDDALAMRASLGAGECAVTRDGALVGANWLSFASQSQLETGVLVREEEIKQLHDRVGELTAQGAQVDAGIAQSEHDLAARRDVAGNERAALETLRQSQTEMHAKLGREESRGLEVEQRIAALVEELGNLGAHAQTDQDEIAKAQALLQRATDQRGALESRRDALLRQKDERQAAVAERRGELGQASDQAHQRALHQQRLEAESASIADGIARLEAQLEADNAHLAQIGDAPQTQDSVAQLQAQLQDMLTRRAEVEQRLGAASDAMADFDNRIVDSDQQRAARVDAVAAAREELAQHRLDRQEIAVRRDTVAEQIETDDHDSQALLAQLPPDAGIESLQQRGEELARKISRIGPVNLVAIEEFDEESERKEYLDRQHADLTEALETLRDVIRKIDRETRARFKETFERLNDGFKEFFPKLFGGGQASLQLTDDDFLTAGVVVMARPPGKRNSHIHLLSGGEKALTAVALLFALFKLHPAPFCMLDEVDAPLDDANVERYCDTLKNLVKVSQMIVITHNKITMEAADVLVGVTMGEPGVSRLVSVDVEQAVEMAAQ